MKKLVAFLTALTLLGGLTACERNKTEVVPDPSPSVSVSPTPTPTPAPSPTPPTVDVALTYDPGELKPWQTAYIQLLEGELERGARGFAEDAEGWRDPWYYLYDIDKDDVPELILMYNGSWDGIAYTYDQGEVNTLNKGDERDSLSINHGVLYTWPEGNGMLYVYSTAWACDFSLYYVDDGQLKWKEVDGPDFEVNEDGYIKEYPEIQTYYPDSQYLNSYSALVYAPERGINFLPIVNYPTPPKADWISLEQREQEEKLVKDVIDNNGWFYCVSKYDDDNGWVTLEEHYQRKHTTLSDTQWQDLNNDGVREAVLRSSYHGLILSAQNGVVYGYDLDFVETVELNRRTGAFEDRTRSHGYYSFRVHFAKNQYYETYYEMYYEGEDIFPRSFAFGSGSGGWGTELDVAEDGTFSGYYQDMDMGGDPPTTSFCRFTGRFSKPEKINEYTYSVRMEVLKKEKAEEWTDKDGMHWIPSIAYGLEDGDEFLIYLPGAPIESLPEYFVQWSAHGYDSWDNETLTGYGLYNVKEQYGWFEY